MRSNKYAYLLLPIVLIIWGTIAVKIYSGVNNTVEKRQNITSISDTSNSFTQEQFVLHDNYLDPFLKNLSHQSNVKKILKTEKQFLPDTIKHNLIFPTITYEGQYKINDGKKIFCMISVNNKEGRYELNDTIHKNIILKKIFKDSIQLLIDRKIVYIKKANNN